MSSSDHTAQKILDSARRLFAQRGYASTTTRAIAQAAGVNEVTLFRRFSNKEGILRALGERIAARQVSHTLADGPPAASVRQTLGRLAQTEVATALEEGGFAIRLAFDAPSVPEVAALLQEGMPSNRDNLAQYLAEQQAAGTLRDDIEPHLMAQAFFALTSSYVMYRLVMAGSEQRADEAIEQDIEQLFEIFWSGAARPGASGGAA